MLHVRDPCDEDVEGCYRVCYASFGYREEPGQNVARELRFLWERPATLAAAVEDLERPPSRRLVGYWGAAFVSDAFVRQACADMPPFVNVRLAEASDGGSPAILAEWEIERAQAGGGLNLLITHWGWDVSLLEPDRLRVQERLSHEFFRRLRGYNVKEALIEVVGTGLCQLTRSLGFRLRRAHGEDPDRSPGNPDLRPFLMGASREEAALGAWISPAFVFTPSRFFFTRAQQELLRLAAETGAADRQLAAELRLTPGAVKKRWDEIFGRVERAGPVAFLRLPQTAGGKRGPEKRSRLLWYLRDHPEELRPISRPGGTEDGAHRRNAP